MLWTLLGQVVRSYVVRNIISFSIWIKYNLIPKPIMINIGVISKFTSANGAVNLT